jgi:hypothetical protein
MRKPESAAKGTEWLVCALPGCEETRVLHDDGLHLYHSAECRDEARRLGLGSDTAESALEALRAVRRTRPLRTTRAGIAAVVAGVGALAVGGAAIAVWSGEEYRLAPVAGKSIPPETGSPGAGEPQPLLPPSANGSTTRPPPPEPPVETTPPRAFRPNPAPYISSVRYDFERGFQGWEIFEGEDILDLDRREFSGNDVLLMEVSDPGNSSVGVTSGAIPSGAKVTYNVYSDGSGDGFVTPLVYDRADREYTPAGNIQLPNKEGFFRVSFTTPTVPVAAIGLGVSSSSDDLDVGLGSVIW